MRGERRRTLAAWRRTACRRARAESVPGARERVLEDVVGDVRAERLSILRRCAEVNPREDACVLHFLERG